MSDYNRILIQYETPFPDDFDMEQVRTRVRNLGPKTDRYPGLEFKLYGMNTLETAAVNEYSSIWLWSNPEPMREFLEGDFFDNYVKAFTRPSVRTWFIHETTGDRSSVIETRHVLRRFIRFHASNWSEASSTHGKKERNALALCFESSVSTRSIGNWPTLRCGASHLRSPIRDICIRLPMYRGRRSDAGHQSKFAYATVKLWGDS